MSAGPLEKYTGISGVADEGGDSLTVDLNVYYAVSCTLGSQPAQQRPQSSSNRPDELFSNSQATLLGSSHRRP
jgi:hypothetical protein